MYLQKLPIYVITTSFTNPAYQKNKGMSRALSNILRVSGYKTGSGYFHHIVTFIKTAYNTNKRWQRANEKIERALRSRTD